MEQTATATPTLGLSTLVKDYVTCNEWANKTLLAWLKQKPAELMEQTVPSSFPSLRETLIHIWDVERYWYTVICGLPPLPSFRFDGFDGSLEEIFEGMQQQSEAFADFVRSQSEQQLKETCYFMIPNIIEATLPRFDLIQHAMNHSTYHRGQLVTIGRNLGITDAPMTDYMFYLHCVKEK